MHKNKVKKIVKADNAQNLMEVYFKRGFFQSNISKNTKLNFVQVNRN